MLPRPLIQINSDLYYLFEVNHNHPPEEPTMSFLSRYWKQVERQVQECYMNPGDVVVDIAAMLKNTEVADNVVPETEPTPVEPKTQTNRPTMDEPMPQYAVDPTAWETRARRSARPGKAGKRMETQEGEYDHEERHTVGRIHPRRQASRNKARQAMEDEAARMT